MIIEKLQGIYRCYSEGKIAKLQAQQELWDVLFSMRKKFLPNWMNEDDFQDFMVFAKQKLFYLLENYDAEISEFSTFFFGVMLLAGQWWYGKNGINVSKKAGCNALLKEGLLYDQPEDIPEDLICAKSWKFQKEENWVLKGESKKKCEIRRDICLVLTIKSCLYIDDNMIEKVSFVTGVEKRKLQQMILDAKESMKKKIERVEKFILRRNFAYFRRKCILIKKLDAEGSFLDSSSIASIDEKLKILDRKWKAAIDLVSRQHMVPTTDVVAKILSMTPRRVHFLLCKASELLMPDNATKLSGNF